MKEIPLPPQSERIWKCTEIPDQPMINPQTAALSGSVPDSAAALTPDDISKMPNSRAFK